MSRKTPTPDVLDDALLREIAMRGGRIAALTKLPAGL